MKSEAAELQAELVHMRFFPNPLKQRLLALQTVLLR
jgi:hypothetical protein